MIDEKQLIREFEMLDDNCNLFLWRSADKIKAGIRRVINRQPKIGKWIKCTKRLPTMEECQKNDCRFIVTDGNRSYARHFDYIDRKFVQIHDNLLSSEDRCVVAWQPFPDPYKEDSSQSGNEKQIGAAADYIMQRFMQRL